MAILLFRVDDRLIHGQVVVGWGSTRGSIEEAVDRLRERGHQVSSVHLRFLSPTEPGLQEIFHRFRQVMTVEINYSDSADAPRITPDSRRRAQLAHLLREQTLMDVDCWSIVPGQPLPPGQIVRELEPRLDALEGSKSTGRKPGRKRKPEGVPKPKSEVKESEVKSKGKAEAGSPKETAVATEEAAEEAKCSA